jgi:hypothetical protein
MNDFSGSSGSFFGGNPLCIQALQHMVQALNGVNIAVAQVINSGSALSVLGRSANSAGTRADIIAGTDGYLLGRSSGALAFMGYAANATGATTRTWQAKVGDRVSVLDFTGVDPTGATDSTTGIANAWAYVKSLTPMPALVFPAGIYSCGTFPNFAVEGARIIAEGVVRLRYTGTADAVFVDGGGSGIGINDVTFGGESPFIIECPKTGQNGFRIRNVHRSTIWVVSRGAGWSGGIPAFAGILVQGCVVTTFHNPKCVAFLDQNASGDSSGWWNGAQPLYGCQVDQAFSGAPASYCTFLNPNFEGCGAGCQMTNGFGNVFVGGTMESNATWGMFYPAGTSSLDNKCIGTSFEANTTGDVQLTGRRNTLLFCDTLALVTVLSEANANTCRIFGGGHQQITIGVNAIQTQVAYVTFDRAASGGTITDNSSTSQKFQNFNYLATIQIQTTLPVAYGGTGDTGTAWTAFTPNVASTTGAITTLGTVVARYKQLGKTVWVQLDITITTNGTGAGHITTSIPTAGIASSGCLAGQEINNTGKALSGSIIQGGSLIGIFFADGTYPGANNNRLILSGIYEST